jgi:hypothetical protein
MPQTQSKLDRLREVGGLRLVRGDAATELTNVVHSECGGARVDAVVVDEAGPTREALKLHGFAYDKVDNVWLRIAVERDASVADLLAVDAVRLVRDDDDSVAFYPRCYLEPSAFAAIGTALGADGCVFRTVAGNRGWHKNGVDDRAFEALQSFVGTRSKERRARREREAVAEQHTEQRAVDAEQRRERALEKRRREQQEDVTFERRDYAYTQLLKRMQRTDTVGYGADGAPNWPDPPRPNEREIVSVASLHLKPSDAEMQNAERRLALEVMRAKRAKRLQAPTPA